MRNSARGSINFNDQIKIFDRSNLKSQEKSRRINIVPKLESFQKVMDQEKLSSKSRELIKNRLRPAKRHKTPLGNFDINELVKTPSVFQPGQSDLGSSFSNKNSRLSINDKIIHKINRMKEVRRLSLD
jgi:hypothetical protein